MMIRKDKRATKKDWAKAFACSIALVLALVALLAPEVGGGFGSGLGAGFGFAGDGAGGSGRGEGVGVGNDEGMGESGDEFGAEDSGDGGGGEVDLARMGGEKKAESIFTFGANSELSEGINPDLLVSDSASSAAAEEARDGGNQSDQSKAKRFKGDRRFGGSGENTFAIIQPNVVPAAPPETGNRFVGGKARKSSSGGATTSRSIGGMRVQGTTLGVVLDTSGSMAPYLDELREEIRRSFSNAVFLEVNGCSLYYSNFDRESFLDGRPPKNNVRSSVMDAMMELVLVYQVDSIYWFSDLQDKRNQSALQQLRNLVWGQNMGELPPDQFDFRKNANSAQRSGFHQGRYRNAVFRLYIRSTDHRPDSVLAAIVRESGGKAQVER